MLRATGSSEPVARAVCSPVHLPVFHVILTGGFSGAHNLAII